MADPFYLLPVLTSTTLFLQLKLGADGASFDQMGPLGKTVMKVLPFCLLPVTMNFPAVSHLLISHFVLFYMFLLCLPGGDILLVHDQPGVRDSGSYHKNTSC